MTLVQFQAAQKQIKTIKDLFINIWITFGKTYIKEINSFTFVQIFWQ
jgi:hypothetical protein